MARNRERTDLIVIHCSATRPNQDIDIKWVHQVHVRKGIYSPNGPSGYHVLIRRNGQLELGRPGAEIGAHALGFNSVSYAICLAGGLDPSGEHPQAEYTLDQWESLAVLVERLHRQFASPIVCGHRELGARKACPSFNVQSWLLEKFPGWAADNTARLEEYLRAHQESQ